MSLCATFSSTSVPPSKLLCQLAVRGQPASMPAQMHKIHLIEPFPLRAPKILR